MAEASDFIPPGSASSLSLVERAAIVLLSMGEEPAAAVLRCLSRDELLDVTQVMSRLSGIKVDWVRTSLQTFFDDYREQSGVHARVAHLPEAIAGPRAGRADRGQRAQQHLRRRDPAQDAAPAMGLAGSGWPSRSATSTSACRRSSWPSCRARWPATSSPRRLKAGRRPRPRAAADGAACRRSTPTLLVELEELVERCLSGLGQQGATVEGVEQVAEILNRMPGQRQQMVELLRAHDPGVVGEIESSMYRVLHALAPERGDADAPHRGSAAGVWAVALKGAEPPVRDALLAAMPRRQAQSFEDLMRRGGPMPMSRVEQARAEIAAQVKALVDVGEIQVQLFAEDAVE